MPGSPRRSYEWRRKAVLAVTVGVVSFVAAEAVLRWWDIGDPPAFTADPHYGYLMRPDQSVSTRGHRFRINTAGFRGPDFVWSKPDGVVRLLFLGDSITYGGGSIPDEALFVNQVASSLVPWEDSVEAVNLSVPGWGIQNMAAYVMTKGLPRADALIWILPAEDFRRPKSTMEEHGFRSKKPWSRLLYVTSVVLRRELGWFSASSGARSSPEETLARNVDAFRRTLELVARGGTLCVVVALPDGAGYEHEELWDDLVRFRQAAESLSIPFLDLGSAFEYHRVEEFFLDEIHLSRLGHEMVASAIAPFLRERIK